MIDLPEVVVSVYPVERVTKVTITGPRIPTCVVLPAMMIVEPSRLLWTNGTTTAYRCRGSNTFVTGAFFGHVYCPICNAALTPSSIGVPEHFSADLSHT